MCVKPPFHPSLKGEGAVELFPPGGKQKWGIYEKSYIIITKTQRSKRLSKADNL
jgi:hypothetical protein